MPICLHRSLPAFAPLLALAACSSPSPVQPDHSAAMVETVPVHGAAEAQRSFSGVVRSRRDVLLAFKQGGRLLSLDVDVGDPVRAGQVLGRLGRTEATAASRQAEAELAAIAVEARQAQDAADRAAGLDHVGALSAAEVRQRALAAQSAEARRAAAAAALRRIREQLADTVLVAPEDGVVTERLAEPGSVVAGGAPVLKLASGGPEVEIRGPADLRLAPDMPAEVRIAGSDLSLRARLRRASPEGDAALHLRAVRFTLLDGPSTLPFGSSVTLTLRPATASSAGIAARVPLSAIAGRDGHPYVWRIAGRDHRIWRQPIRILAWRGDDALVTGLDDGQHIVATAADTLAEGQTVVAAGVAPGFE